jgi:serine/threonine-protein kinase HipA
LLLEAGLALGLATATAQRLLENLRSRIVQTAETLYAEYEEANTKLLSRQPHVPVSMAGETRCLRTILHVVIKQIAKQIA